MGTLSFEAFIPLLICPECSQALRWTQVEQPQAVEGEYGVLECPCSSYPVVDGIPILTHRKISVLDHVSGAVGLEGPSPAELVRKVEERQGLQALLSLVVFPVIPASLNREPFQELAKRPPLLEIGLILRKNLVKWHLFQHHRLTARDWLELIYHRSPVQGDYFNYFFFRFGQPRHLAALSLLSVLPRRDKPLLDLACGFGHLIHYLTQSPQRHRVVGFDRLFFQLWVAKHFIAPQAQFVCGDAEDPLPFQDGAFSGVVCSDAFHLLRRKAEVLAELRRCAPGGALLLTRVGNREVRPNEGSELSPEEYLSLSGNSPVRMVGETEVVARYLRRLGPALSSPREPLELRDEKWLSLLIGDECLFRDYDRFEAWPHGVGTLQLNPIYQVRHKHGHLDLEFKFPSDWYAFENGVMRQYHPQAWMLDASSYGAIRQGQRTPETEELLGRFVLLGMPEHYTR